jgi:diguanylate cyclase (GGDEF)-like protein
LAVYIIEDALEARNLIYGLLVTNVFASFLGWLTALTLHLPGAINAYNLAPALFTASPRVLTVSIVALYVDTIVIILLYEQIGRFTKSLLARIFISLTITLVMDTLMFITGAYVESPQYLTILTSSTIGKVAAGTIYSLALWFYLRRIDKFPVAAISQDHAPSEMFRTLTYRQRYEMLREASSRDPLTGLYNRGFFNDIFTTLVSTAARAGTTLALLMIDIDNFKTINDTQGHIEGDRVLGLVAGALQESFRSSDYVCRFGGEEFAVLLPNAGEQQASTLAETARVKVLDLQRAAALRTEVTVTIGVAVFPTECESARDLLLLADRRLYAGKMKGRNQVVGGIAE